MVGTENSLFDVWIRIRPFKEIPPPSANEVHTFRRDSRPLNRRDRSISNSRSQSKGISRSPSLNKCVMDPKPDDYRVVFTAGTEIVFREKTNPKLKHEKKKKSKQAIEFSSIFNESQNNRTIFFETVEPRIDECIKGKNLTFITYGISGAGKTHTIFGRAASPQQKPESGVISYTALYLFLRQQELKGDESFELRLSFLEIYNEQVYNLLAQDPNPEKLSIVESASTNGVVIPGLESIKVSSCAELLCLVEEAISRRIVSKNRNNLNSSRSHVVIEIQIQSNANTGSGRPITSKLRFVDLAGSEKVCMETKENINEGSNINKSLLALTNCINILSDKKRAPNSFIPYRNSKLTRILKDSLGGDTPVVMIVCLAPNFIFLEETLNSIKYAQKATQIEKQPPKARQVSSSKICEEEYKRKIKLLEKECTLLRSALKQKVEAAPPVEIETIKQKPNDTQSSLNFDSHSEEEFKELLQALIENIEDSNIVKQNIAEIDEIIEYNDSKINSLQSKFKEPSNEEESALILEELKTVADKLEENLDLKESALKESESLKDTIESTKTALIRLYRARGSHHHYNLKASRSNVVLDTITTCENKENETKVISPTNQDNPTKRKNVLGLIKNLQNSFRPHLNTRIEEKVKIEEIKENSIDRIHLLIKPLKFKNSEISMKSEAFTLVYSDSERIQSTKRQHYAEKSHNIGRFSPVLESPSHLNSNSSARYARTHETTTNPMSLISNDNPSTDNRDIFMDN